MNNLFGGGPPGAGRQSGSAADKPGTATGSRVPAGDASSSGSAGLGGWGNMFKSALNQMESHLDRYLELPNDAQPHDPRQRQRHVPSARSTSSARLQSGSPSRPSSVQPQTGAAAADSKATEYKTAVARAVASDTPSLRSSASASNLQQKSDGLQRKGSTALRGATRTQTPLRDTMNVREDDVSSELLDAFGVDLDDAQRTQSDDAIEHTASPAAQGPAAARPKPENEFESVEPNGARLDSVDAAAAAAAEAPEPVEQQTDSPYIQAELKKLREAAVPLEPEAMRSTIDEYRQRIEALLVEGQAWSSKELRLSNTIKKLRADGKAYEKTAHMVQKKLDLTLSRNDELNEKLKRASLADRSSSDNVKALRAKAQEADGQRRQLEHDLRVAAETRNSLKIALTSAESEITTLRSELATTKAQQAQAISSAQRDARADAERRVAEANKLSASERQRLQSHIDELQQRVLVVEEEAREREVSLLTQIRTLRTQLRSADAHSRDIGGEIQQHTRPLLQQIEELQARQTEQRHEWMRKDDEWAARMRESAKELENMQAKLRDQSAEAERAQDQIAAASKQVDARQAEIGRLTDQLLAEAKIRAEVKQQLEEARATIHQLNAKLDSMAALRSVSAEAAAISVSPALSSERGGASHARNPSISSISSIDSRSRRGSSAEPPSQPDGTAGAAHATTKKLSSQITSLKAQLQTALKQKDEYSRNLVDLSLETEQLRAEAAKHSDLDKELEALRRRHDTALEMLGEKTEELMDLQADMEDMRTVYKQQLQSLAPEK
ncbi:TATA element modulatory factor 1 [Coemansia sp. RSA 2705]|nr:TATA element modulatory factor 1 [Coemansia sp. RSA 2705]